MARQKASQAKSRAPRSTGPSAAEQVVVRNVNVPGDLFPFADVQKILATVAAKTT